MMLPAYTPELSLDLRALTTVDPDFPALSEDKDLRESIKKPWDALVPQPTSGHAFGLLSANCVPHPRPATAVPLMTLIDKPLDRC